MAHILRMHPQNPEPRLIKQAAKIVMDGGVIVYPTDSTYALGCHMGDKAALERIRRLRQLDDRHNFTLVCADLSAIATYARVHNVAYRLLKANTPGPYTFILSATPEVPRRLMHPKRKTIGIRVPDSIVAQALIAEVGEPLMSTSLILPDDEFPLIDAYEIEERVGHAVDLIIESGACGIEATTVIDLVDGVDVVRVGKGNPDPFQ